MLNSQQQLAVSIDNKINALILAGAGTGKTRVLTQRIIYLVEHNFAILPEILAFTFTNKAAAEMFSRIKNYYHKTNYNNCSYYSNNDFMNSYIGTFHKICYQILLQNYQYAGLNKDFQIIDEIKQNAYITDIIKTLNLNAKIYDGRKICYLINSYKNLCLRSQVDISLLATKSFYELQTLQSLKNSNKNIDLNSIQQIYQQYEQICQQQNIVDFDELLLRCYELLLHNESIRLNYQNAFKYILVDEFQDTNYLQYKFIKLLTKHNPNIFIFFVADNNQSIYSFRGANPQILQDLNIDFPNLITIKLTQNYRSTPTILTAANAIIAHNDNDFSQQLWTNYYDNYDKKIQVFICDNAASEANIIANEILNLLNIQLSKKNSNENSNENSNFDFSNIAILYRTNKQASAFEKALTTNNIPYNIYNPKNNIVTNDINYFDNSQNFDLENTNSVKLLTMHSAKGLEFNIVFIVGLEEDLFPNFLNTNIAEERRLMYVAITRAKQLLYLSFAKFRFSYQQRSRFLAEIPNDLLVCKNFL